MNDHKESVVPCVTQVTRCGVVSINDGYDSDIKVNTDSMISLIREAVDGASTQPACDYNGHFAGRVTIIVELVGDVIEGDSDAKNKETP